MRLPAGLALVLAAAFARGQGAPEATALRVESAPLLDGDVLGDAAWQAAVPATGFRQTAPFEGEPVSEETEVRLVYTSDTLYVGVLCRDREPERIIVSDAGRDASLDDTDSFRMVLDTYRDRQNGFVFGTNAAGIAYDGQVVGEGQGILTGPGRQQGGTAMGFNLNWDGAWSVRTKVGEFGWSAEFAIPFRTLRYARGGEQLWGLNFQRTIRRRKEAAFWAPLPRQYGLLRVSEAGLLKGVETPKPRNLQAIPYALAEASSERGASTLTDADVGGDLKWGVTPSLTLDVTVNTDFAQVEVDEQRINLDRFNLFFPEKRPFFLENAGLFAAGRPEEVELFFSRRIGIAPTGEVVPILAGARLSGRIGGWSVGLLDMQTRSVPELAPADNFAVARVFRDLPNRSGVGVMLANRATTGGSLGGAARNRTYGLDGRLGFGRYGQVSGFAAATDTPGIEGSEHAFRLGAVWDAPRLSLDAGYMDVGSGFNPELGFLARPGGFRKPQGRVLFRIRPEDLLGLQELRPHVSYEGHWRPGGFQLSGFLHVDNHFEWRNGWELHTGVNFTHEGVEEPFAIDPSVVVPTGSYDHSEGMFVLISDQSKPASLNATLTVGGFFGGQRVSLDSTVKGRAGERLTSDLGWVRNDVELPWGDFVTNLLRARVSYSFTTRLMLQGLVQYNDRSDAWSTNLRFSWLQSANAGLFVVYNELREVQGVPLAARDRSFTVKFSRLVELLR